MINMLSFSTVPTSKTVLAYEFTLRYTMARVVIWPMKRDACEDQPLIVSHL